MLVRKLAIASVVASALVFAVVRCSGDDGKMSLVRVVNEAAGDNCAQAGFRVLTGIDDNGNGTLDDNEVDSASFVCNGAGGTPGAADAPCNLRRYGSCKGADLRNLVVGETSAGNSVDFTGMDFSGADLRNAAFQNTTLDHANLVGAKLDGARIISGSWLGVDMTNATARFAIFAELYMDGSKLDGADFTDATLIVALRRVTAVGAKFVRAYSPENIPFFHSDVSNADFTDAKGFRLGAATNYTNANFTRADLTGSELSTDAATASNLTGAIFDFATLVGVKMENENVAAAASFTNAYYADTTLVPAGVDLAARGALNLTAAGTNLSGKDLRALRGVTNFTNFNLTDANLTGWQGTFDFTNATLVRTNLTDANLSQSTLSGANCDDANFTNADLSAVVLSASTKFTNANFDRASLRGRNLLTIDMTGAKLVNTTLFGTNLGTITGTPVFTNAFTRGTTVAGTPSGLRAVDTASDLTGADLKGIKLIDGDDFIAARFTNADFTGATIFKSDFNGVDLAGANFTNADLQQVDFSLCNLTGANFTGANLRDTSLLDANFTNANLTNAKLRCADVGMSESSGNLPNFTGAIVSGAECPDASLASENTPATCENRGLGVTATDWMNAFCAAGEIVL